MRTVEPMEIFDKSIPISEQLDPFYAEYLEMESSILGMITTIESRLSSRVLNDQEDHVVTKAVRAVTDARITVGKADAAVRGGDPAHNAKVIRDTFGGTRGAVRDIVVLNAAAGLVVAGVAECWADGVERAQASIDSGAANGVVDALITTSNAVAK